MPDNLIYSGVLIIASKFYTNSVLAVYVSFLPVQRARV